MDKIFQVIIVLGIYTFVIIGITCFIGAVIILGGIFAYKKYRKGK